MKRKSLTIYYEYSSVKNYIELLELCISNLDYNPNLMNISLGNERLTDLDYNILYLKDLLKGEVFRIDILSDSLLQDEISNIKRFTIIFNKNLGYIEVNFSNADNLIENIKIYDMLFLGELIIAMLYDSEDVNFQSIKDIDVFKSKYPNKKHIITKGKFNDNVIDTSKNYGRRIVARSMGFIIAPTMWFGEFFQPVLSFEKLLKYKGATTINRNNKNVVEVNLFSINDEPYVEQNHLKQKYFWEFLGWDKVLEEFEKYMGNISGYIPNRDAKNYILGLFKKK